MTTTPQPENEPTPPAVKYYAVVLTAEGALETRSFDTLAELTEHLRGLIDRDVSVSCFAGTRLGISKPPFRYLLTPEGPQPLFALPEDNLEEDESGYLGVDPIHLEGPPAINVPRQNAVEPDEFFSDDNNAAIDIFDNALPDPDT
jgi:hypothetical protein